MFCAFLSSSVEVCMNEFRSNYHQDTISRSLSGFNYLSNPFNAASAKVFQSFLPQSLTMISVAA